MHGHPAIAVASGDGDSFMSSTAPQLTMLSAEQFGARGITFAAPRQPAGLEAVQVRQQLLANYGVSDIKDLVLAHVADPMQSPTFDRTCWVVSVAGHPRSRPPVTRRYPAPLRYGSSTGRRATCSSVSKNSARHKLYATPQRPSVSWRATTVDGRVSDIGSAPAWLSHVLERE